jgi:class 3 adenylate cyclase
MRGLESRTGEVLQRLWRTTRCARPSSRRRIVVALFCDLVGSTQLAERTDPEVLKHILDG